MDPVQLARVTADLMFRSRHYHESTALSTQCVIAALKLLLVFVDTSKYTDDKFNGAHLGDRLFSSTSQSAASLAQLHTRRQPVGPDAQGTRRSSVCFIVRGRRWRESTQ